MDEKDRLTDSNASKTGVERRTLIKGAAWSVPVVSAALAMPVAAATNVCDTSNRQPNGLANVIATSWPDYPATGNIYLASNTTYQWIYSVTLLQVGLASSFGEFGINGSSSLTDVSATVSDPRFTVSLVPGWETQMHRVTLNEDVPAGTAFTVTFTARTPAVSPGSGHFSSNAWWQGIYRNVTCGDPGAPAFTPSSDGPTNVWDTDPAGIYGDPVIVFTMP